MGPFNYFGTEAMVQKNYKPDYSAQVIRYAKVLRIKQLDYVDAISNLPNYTWR